MTDPNADGQLRAVQGSGQSLQALSREPRGEASFDELFCAHYGYVCRALRSMGVHPSLTEDLAQDVFIVLHRRLADFDPSQNLRSWLWGIARRVASTHGRTQFRAERKLKALPDPVAPAGPEEQVELRRRADVVAEFLASLPEEQRVVFVMVELESRSAPEIAEALGVKLNTVYSRLRGARERFKAATARHRARAGRQRGGGGG